MKKHITKDFTEIIGTTGSMLLFAAFALCMLIMISAAASTYSRISVGFEKTFGSSSALGYVSNKLRSAEDTQLLGDGSGAAVINGKVACVIYCSDGGIYEKNVPLGGEYTLTGGSRIFDAESLNITEENWLYRVVVANDGEDAAVLVRKG